MSKPVPSNAELEINTEFDQALSGVKRKIFTILGAALGLFLAVEAVIIFFVVGDAGAVRIQSMNGAFVMAGGLTVVTVTSLLLILPTKLIAYESLKLVRQSSTDLNRFVDKADKVMDRMEALATKFDGQSDQAVLDLKDESRKIREELEKVRKAFTAPIKSPMAGRTIRAVSPEDLAHGYAGTKPKEAGDNGDTGNAD